MAAPMVWHESCSPTYWKEWVLFSFGNNSCVTVNKTLIIMITVKEFIKSSRLLRMHRRYLCSSSGSKNRKSKKYADTINLPRTQFQLSMKDVSTREKEVQSVSFSFSAKIVFSRSVFFFILSKRTVIDFALHFRWLQFSCQVN